MFRKYLKVIAIITALFEALLVPTSTNSDNPQWIVRLHDTFRTLVGFGEGFTVGNMRKMRWDRALAYEATILASCDRLAAKTPKIEYDRLGLPIKGYNKGIGNMKATSIQFIRNWFENRKYYNPKTNMCFYGKECLTYMQLVSADTFKVGCAINRSCLIDKIPVSSFVCVYSPGVNLANPIYRIGDRCSLCKRNAAFCEHGLCSNCHPQKTTKCDCRKTCRTNKGFGILSKHSCTCHCIYGHGPNCESKCKNPEMYVDYDICNEVKEDECHSNDYAIRAMLEEFCPEQCACRRKPHAFG